MILTCPNCSTRYQTDAASFAPPGRNVRCAKCGKVWFQGPPEIEVEPEPAPDLADTESEPRQMAASAAPAMDDEAMGRRPRERERGRERVRERRGPSRLGRAGAWAVLLAVVLVILVGLVQYRQMVASLWPKAATLYAAIGMPVNVLGLDFRDVRPAQSFAGQPVLEVTGRIVNVSDHRIPVPSVRVALVDGEAREVYHWIFDSGVGTLAPGAAGPFSTRLSSPPPEAKTVIVRFLEAGEK